jgi:hypothetical protein
VTSYNEYVIDTDFYKHYYAKNMNGKLLLVWNVNYKPINSFIFQYHHSFLIMNTVKSMLDNFVKPGKTHGDLQRFFSFLSFFFLFFFKTGLTA